MYRCLLILLALASTGLARAQDCPHLVIQTIPSKIIEGPWVACVATTIIIDGQIISRGRKECPRWLLLIPPIDYPVSAPESNTRVVRSHTSEVLLFEFKCRTTTQFFIRIPLSCDPVKPVNTGYIDRLKLIACARGGD